MLFLGFVFFMVSTLAVHGGVIDSDGCNKEYCTEKPKGYPQKEIDQQVYDQLDFFKAIKVESRLINASGLEEWSLGGNCAAINKTIQPYTITRGAETIVILQSKYFKQTILDVKCTGENADEAKMISELPIYQAEGSRHECFKDFIVDNNVTAKCVQQASRVQLYTWLDGEIVKEDLDVNSDCACLRT